MGGIVDLVQRGRDGLLDFWVFVFTKGDQNLGVL